MIRGVLAVVGFWLFVVVAAVFTIITPPAILELILLGVLVVAILSLVWLVSGIIYDAYRE